MIKLGKLLAVFAFAAACLAQANAAAAQDAEQAPATDSTPAYDGRFIAASWNGLSGLIWIPTEAKMDHGDARFNYFHYTVDSDSALGPASKYEATYYNPSIAYASSRNNEYSISFVKVDEDYNQPLAGLGYVPRTRQQRIATIAFKHTMRTRLKTPVTLSVSRSNVEINDGADGHELEASLTASVPFADGCAHFLYGIEQTSIGRAGVDTDDDWENFGVGLEYLVSENLIAHVEKIDRHGAQKQVSDQRAIGLRYLLNETSVVQVGMMDNGQGANQMYLSASHLIENNRKKKAEMAPAAE